MNKFLSLIICCITFIFLFCGCHKFGNLNDGDCICNISLETIPSEFLVEEDGKDFRTYISILITNMSSGKSYLIDLNKDNKFRESISIDSGTYKIDYCYFSSRYISGVNIESREENVKLTKESEGHINLYVSNLDEVPSLVNYTTATEEIVNADKFSKLIKIGEQVFSLEDILSHVSFSNNYSSVAPYSEITLTNKDYGLSVTLVNTLNESVPWEQCKVKSVNISSYNAILPGGLNLYMPMKEIVNERNGVYGKPDKFNGSIFWIYFKEKINATYIDENTGDRIIIKSNNSKDIKLITYEFNVF